MPLFRADEVEETVWQWVKDILQHPDQLAEGLRAEKAEAERADLSEHILTNIPADEDIAAIVTHCEEVGEGLDNATIDDKRKYFDWLDVRGKLAVENGEKVVYAKCRIGERRLSLVQTSP